MKLYNELSDIRISCELCYCLFMTGSISGSWMNPLSCTRTATVSTALAMRARMTNLNLFAPPICSSICVFWWLFNMWECFPYCTSTLHIYVFISWILRTMLSYPVQRPICRYRPPSVHTHPLPVPPNDSTDPPITPPPPRPSLLPSARDARHLDRFHWSNRVTPC